MKTPPGGDDASLISSAPRLFLPLGDPEWLISDITSCLLAKRNDAPAHRGSSASPQNNHNTAPTLLHLVGQRRPQSHGSNLRPGAPGWVSTLRDQTFPLKISLIIVELTLTANTEASC